MHVAALTMVSLAIAGLVPLLFFPFAKTLWATIDYLVYRASPEYRAGDAAERAEGNGVRYRGKTP